MPVSVSEFVIIWSLVRHCWCAWLIPATSLRWTRLSNLSPTVIRKFRQTTSKDAAGIGHEFERKRPNFLMPLSKCTLP
ncbi:hypothetical protein V8F33_010787 [Rhypophila sp. PSN 637]